MKKKQCPRCNRNRPINKFGTKGDPPVPKSLCRECDADIHKISYHGSPEKRADVLRITKEAHRKRLVKGLCWQCDEKVEEGTQRCGKHNKENQERNTENRISRRRQCFDHYGWACVCCGETCEKMLTFDHINRDGAAHRKSMGGQVGGTQIVTWAIRNGFPPILQTMCFNCNIASFRNGGICPHKEASSSKYIDHRE